MKIKKTNFKGLKLIEGITHFDQRGFFREIFKSNALKNHKPLFWCLSKSKKNVLRGLHIQVNFPQEKFISVIKGKIFDVVIDLRKGSKTFGKYFKTILSAKKSNSLLVPAGFAHGFLTLDKENIVVYSNNKYRREKSEIGLAWNDKELKINWPKKKFYISKKDKKNMTFEEYKKKFIKIK